MQRFVWPDRERPALRDVYLVPRNDGVRKVREKAGKGKKEFDTGSKMNTYLLH